MEFYDLLDHVVALLQRRGRVTYNALKLQFHLDDEQLAVLKDELLYAHPQVVDDAGRGLRWTGDTSMPQASAMPAPQHEPQSISRADYPPQDASHTTPRPPEAERRQLTVLFCDLVDSTRLAGQLDPEDLREVVLAYQAVCVEVLQRFDGHVAQYLGDGLLVYFGYPQAHEDDAQRAVRTGLRILDGMGTLNTRLEVAKSMRLAVRIGIHTGAVVVGTMGSGGRHEQLALGETPNLAARLQSLATPDTVVISDTTHRLVQGYFRCDDLGNLGLKGVETPRRVYRVVAESAAQSRLDVAAATGLTPLVGREPEVGLLRERWAQSQEGLGQVVVLSGEAGIGKSRLVQVLTERVVDAGTPCLTLRCSPYHTHSAFYPVIEHLQRLLQWPRDATPAARLAMLEQALQTAGLPLEVVPLLAALLSLPVPEGYPPLTLSPQRQKQQTLEALVAWLLADAARQPVLAVWEDLHWADPSTLELLGLLIDQTPTARLLLVLTCRPEFRPRWMARSYLTQITVTHFTRQQIEQMAMRVTGGKPLPAEVVQQIVAKTDGIPLFVEELVKTILESGLVREEAERYVLTGPLPPLAIPATIQDALMARLDRLAPVKEVAQLGAVLGREFAYALLRAVVPLDEAALQHGLTQLVEAELLYQRGHPPLATYVFKHALVQDTAYRSLLKSTRQQYHQRIAQVLVERFSDMLETQPELVAQHYTEAGLAEQAILYWQQAGHVAQARWAHEEAIAHLTTGLAMLMTLPETRERDWQELTLRINLGKSLAATKGWAAPEAEATYVRAWEICQQASDTPHLLSVLWGLAHVSVVRADLPKHREVGARIRSLAEQQSNTLFLLVAHWLTGQNLLHVGEFTAGLEQLEQAYTLYDAQHHPTYVTLFGVDIGVFTLCYMSHALWSLGYPEQAVQRSHKALGLAQEMQHPFSKTLAQVYTATLQQFRREPHTANAHAEVAIALCIEHDFAYYRAWAMIIQGWCLRRRQQLETGTTQMQEGLTALRATGGELRLSYYLALLAEARGEDNQPAVGLGLVTEAFTHQVTTQERWTEAELYRLKGELLLARSAEQHTEAEASFQQALEIARQQQAKSLELRAAMSLARLWQQQGKPVAARQLLAPLYGWFTEGFDTADLQEARALLEELT